MERKILKDIFRRRLELAERFLNTSKTNLEHGDLRSAVDRAYYAAQAHLQPLLLHCGVDLALALGPPPHQHHPGPGPAARLGPPVLDVVVSHML